LTDKARVMELVLASRIREARELCKRICDRHPGDAEAWYLLGSLHGQAGEFEEAEACCLKALDIVPGHAGLHYNLAMARLNQGKADAAVASFEKAVSLEPGFAEAYHDLGNAYYLAGNHEKAEGSYRNAIRLKPEFAAAYFNLAHVLGDQARWDEAVASYECTIRLQPQFEQAYSEVAGILINRFMYDKVVELLSPATGFLPDSTDIHFKLGAALQGRGDADDALLAYRRVLSIAPEHVDAQVGIAGILGLMGRYSEAGALLLPLIDKGDASNSTLITYGHLAHHFDRVDDAINLLQRHLDADLDDNTRAKISFALGGLYDRCKEYDKAFSCIRSGNKLRHASYDDEYYGKLLRALEEIYNSDLMQQVKCSGNPTEIPVFIVGMPRSGTSLVEQILASHPQVYGAGELSKIGAIVDAIQVTAGAGRSYPYCMEQISADTLKSHAQDYLDEIRARSGGRLRVTDKMPDNFWHLGLINILFPKARVIHCIRSPLDTCLSCYFHYFGGSHSYAYDLTDLGKYYRKYQQVMRHWKKVLRIPLLDVDYEALVRDQEGMTRRLLEFCGLPWDPACLNFYESSRTVATASSSQVRKPLYSSSVERWRNYEEWLAPLKEALEEQVQKDQRK